LLKTFIVSLQEQIDSKGNYYFILGRIHCSLNINTETGRLSARRPNLQNQPALEKDKY
jgi:DNA polymerase I-like protein with 3'-5' exonuclease and polymerase domains